MRIVAQVVERVSGASIADRIGHAWQQFLCRSVGLMPQLSRYTLVSIAALATDFTVYIGLCSSEVKASLAGVAGYAVGMFVHYILSSRFVFNTQGSDKSESRRFIEFMLSGLVGITLTGFIIAMATGAFGVPPIGAKVVATIISFGAVFAIRRSFVFAA
jgi:putative flippase GtrA